MYCVAASRSNICSLPDSHCRFEKGSDCKFFHAAYAAAILEQRCEAFLRDAAQLLADMSDADFTDQVWPFFSQFCLLSDWFADFTDQVRPILFKSLSNLAINQKRSTVAQLVRILEKGGALEHSVVVAATASDCIRDTQDRFLCLRTWTSNKDPSSEF